MQTRTSTTLLQALADPHNERAWRRFFTRYAPMLLSYARHVGLCDADAQDVVGDTLSVFVQSYRAGRYDRERARLKSWLGGIAQNKVRKLFAKRRPLSLEAVAPGDGRRPLEPSAPDHADAAFDREWQLQRLSLALEILRSRIDPNTYQAFDLYALKDWPAAKVAAFLNMTSNAVYISKTRTLQRLRRIIQELGEDEE